MKEVNAIKGLLQKYNSCVEDSSEAITYTSALDPAVVLTLLSTVTTSYDLSSKNEIIDAYLMFLRSKEEVDLLPIEAQNANTFYEKKKQIIKTGLESNSLSSGAKCLLYQLLGKVKMLLGEVRQTQLLMKNSVPTTHIESDDSDSAADSDVSEYFD